MSKDLPEKLKKTVSRGVVIVESPHPKKDESIKEVLFTIRPWWSKIGANETALPGGTIEEEDLIENFDPEDLIQLEAVYKQALIRELEEELGEEIKTLVLGATFYFLGLFENNGWETASFLLELPEKPVVEVKADSAGTVWHSEESLREEKENLFQDHPTIVAAAFAKLEEIRARHQD